MIVLLLAATAFGADLTCGSNTCDDTAQYCDADSACQTLIANGGTCSDVILCATGQTCASDNVCKADDGESCKAAVDPVPATDQPWLGRCDGDTKAENGDITTSCSDDGVDDGDSGATPPTTDSGAETCGDAVALAADGVAAGEATGACRATVTEPVLTGATTPAAAAVVCGGSNAAGASTCEGEVIADDNTATDGTCTAAVAAAAQAGETGGDCRAVITAIAACDGTLAVTGCPSAGAASTAGDNTFCGAAAIADAAEGADGGACRLVVDGQTACIKVDVAADSAATPPVEAVVGDVCNGADSAATPPVAGTCGAPVAADDAPAAIFYGMSMVTAAVAYLL